MEKIWSCAPSYVTKFQKPNHLIHKLVPFGVSHCLQYFLPGFKNKKDTF